jgi:hypothetical protein
MFSRRWNVWGFAITVAGIAGPSWPHADFSPLVQPTSWECCSHASPALLGDSQSRLCEIGM